jgi:hypothetical protein
MKGFSRTNLLYMRAFAEAYPDESFVQQLAGHIPWFHNCVLLDSASASSSSAASTIWKSEVVNRQLAIGNRYGPLVAGGTERQSADD